MAGLAGAVVLAVALLIGWHWDELRWYFHGMASASFYRGGPALAGRFEAAGVPSPGSIREIAVFERPPYYNPTSGLVVAAGVAYLGVEKSPRLRGGPRSTPWPDGPAASLLAIDLETYEILWQSEDGGGTWASTPSVAFDEVYFGGRGGNVYCAQAKTGRILWSFSTGSGRPFSTGAVTSTTFYIAGQAGVIYALERRTGRLRWKVECGASRRFAVAWGEGRVYYSGRREDPHVGALDGRTGRQLWKNPLRPDSYPVVGSTMVYVLGNARRTAEGFITQQNLHALRAEDGSLVWKHQADEGVLYRIGPSTSETAGPAVANTSLVLFTTYYGHVYAVDARDGSRRWKVATAGPMTSGPSVACDVVYVNNCYKELLALDLHTGGVLWKHKCAKNGWLQTSPVVLDGAVYTADVTCQLVEVRGKATAGR